MIPRTLSLTNFMCYRQVTVDFSGLHVACLSGENGAGKSTLLDAMTWALWGKARARRDDELIHLGQDEMEVEFTFELGEEVYRTIRRRRSSKRGQSLLDFQVRDGDRWRSIAESTIRDTEAKIEHTLRLDYDTFVNSAFLRQGRADEFTIKTAAERKRVLGEILGLDVWATYEDRAKERLRSVQDEAHALELRLAEIDAELARRPEYEEQVQTAEAQVSRVTAALQKAQTAWQALETARAELSATRAQLEELGVRVAQGEREFEALEREKAEREERLAQHQDLLAHADEIEAGFATHQKALEQERALGEKLTTLAGLNEERGALEAQITEARHGLETQRQVAARQVGDLQARLPTPELRAAHENVQAQVTHLTQLRESREAARDDLARLAEERAALQAHNGALRPEMETLKERIDLLQQAQANCPLCGQPLSEHDRLRVVEELQAEGRTKGDTYRSNRDRLQAIEGEVEGLETQIAQSEPLLADLPALEEKRAKLGEQVRAAEEAEREMETARSELERLEEELGAEAYAPEPRAALASVLGRATKLGYDAAAHEATRRAVATGQVFADRKVALDAARAGVELEQTALARVVAAIQRWQEQITSDRARQAEREQAAAQLEQQLQDAAAVEEKLAQVRAEEAESRRRLGAAEQRLATCDVLVQQKESRSQRRDELAHLEGLYAELRTAFGVHGVPAMIIEAAVPEIEAEANRLLNRMTAGRMHVRLETQRETLAGTVRETLDIRIMDELGERPYDNFSGGEQFRINFALRIALSRLLARRAGAELQTLIIDEGFGTQDAQGRERLVEVIHAIQDEFARVLVITHIEELQDAFPVQIHVTKTPEGSVVELL
jgi:exonuclease SbcC